MAETTASPTQEPRWMATTELDGAWQMAIDSWLLDQGRPAFRLYRWRRPTLGANMMWTDLRRSSSPCMVWTSSRRLRAICAFL